MGSPPLYALTDDLLALYERIEEADGEVSPELAAMLDEASGSFEAKVSNCLARIREWEADARNADDEIKRLHAMKVARGNRAARLRAYVLECMRAAGKTRVDTGVMGTAYVTPPKRRLAVDVAPEALESRFQRVKVEPDKRALGAALDAGEDVPARWVAGEPSLVIK